VKLKKTVLLNGIVAWGVSSSKYVQSDVHNVHEYMAALPDSKKLHKKAPDPFIGGYKPGIDMTPEFYPVMMNFFQS
jgi:hypothetical protein